MTEQVKHTPGPWKVGKSWENPAVVYDTQEYRIASCVVNLEKRGEEEIKANAALIAAAPELLDALEKARDHLFAQTGGDALVQLNRGNVLFAINTAIAKAEGRAR